MSNLISPAQLIEYEITDFVFVTRSLPDDLVEPGLSLGESFAKMAAQPNDDRVLYQQHLHVALNTFEGDEDEHSFRAAIRISMRGKLSVPTPKEGKEKESEEWAHLNAISLLYSSIRSYVDAFSKLTSQDGIRLPAIIPDAFLEEKASSE
ncbi:MAG: hypothetical protein FWE46_01600 [Coriobacteriia bacterium]|nr:hypothetical protein [Coriobacteriia bacterium]MCL2536871.1 hypothetical protein [Coriobacteriia bacterium]